MAPPTAPGPIVLDSEPSRWPKVIGIIAIVLGALGALGNAMGLLQPFLLDVMGAAAPPQAQGQMQAQIAVTRAWLPYTMTLSAIQAALAILLLVAGVLLISRSRAAPLWMMIWAVLKLIAAVVSAFIGHRVQADTMEAMRAAGTMPTLPGMRAFAVFGLVLAIMWGCAFPAFTLVWLSLASVRREVRTWA